MKQFLERREQKEKKVRVANYQAAESWLLLATSTVNNWLLSLSKANSSKISIPLE